MHETLGSILVVGGRREKERKKNKKFRFKGASLLTPYQMLIN
jgi:hypothetical protein